MMEPDTWKGKENLGNAKEVIEEFEKEYRRHMEDVRKQEREKGTFRRGELPGRFMVRKLFGQSDKKYDKEYWARLERNWRRQKGGRAKEQRTIEIIKEKEEEIKQGDLGIKEQIEEDNNKIGNICDPYYKL